MLNVGLRQVSRASVARLLATKALLKQRKPCMNSSCRSPVPTVSILKVSTEHGPLLCRPVRSAAPARPDRPSASRGPSPAATRPPSRPASRAPSRDSRAASPALSRRSTGVQPALTQCSSCHYTSHCCPVEYVDLLVSHAYVTAACTNATIRLWRHESASLAPIL